MAQKTHLYPQYEYPDLEVGDQDHRWCHRYAHDVVNGIIKAGKWIRLACQRHLNDLERKDVYFDDEQAESVVTWFEIIPITDGANVGDPTTLLPWQIFMVCCLAAWKITATDFRKYKYCYCQVGRKNGKSTLAGGLSLYFMYASGCFRPRVYSVATKKDQAKELWSAAQTMIELSPTLQTIFEARAHDILMPEQKGEFIPLASDSNTLDGKNPLMVNLDECHAIKDRNLYGVMVSAFGAQDEGLMLTITTAGTILDGICTDLNKQGKTVLQKIREQDSYLYLIYEIDEIDEWDDENAWIKANPGLGHQPRLQYLRDRRDEAYMSTEELANFKTKHCNLFVVGADRWLDINEVKQCRDPNLNIDKYLGKKCWVGFDRSLVSDITSFCLLFPNEQGGVDCFYINILPAQAVKKATDYLKQIYTKAESAGNLEIMPGKTIQNRHLYPYFEWIRDHFDVQMFAYDPYKMKEAVLYLEDEKGYDNIVSVSQGVGNMSEPSKKLESLIKEGIFKYDDNLFEFSCTNAILGVTKMNNVSVYRENDKTEKIDPLIATIIALSCATLQKVDVNPYEKRGLLCA